MIDTFEFLYYCQYRVFALVKRVGEKDENLASLFYSLLLATNTGMALFIFRYIIPKKVFLQHPTYDIYVKLSYASIFFIWYFTCKSYFVKKKNYLRIVSFYERKYQNKNGKMALLGILYSLVTFLSFIGLAMLLSRL